MVLQSAIAVAIVSLGSTLPPLGNYGFDLGPRDSQVAEGCRTIYADTVYNATRGYGLRQTAGGALDGRPSVRADALGCDGLYADRPATPGNPQPLALQVDLPPGSYAVDVTVGGSEGRVTTDLLCNGQPVATAQTETLEGEPPAEQITLRFLYKTDGGPAIVTVVQRGGTGNWVSRNSLRGIRFLRHRSPILVRGAGLLRKGGAIRSSDANVVKQPALHHAAAALRYLDAEKFLENIAAYRGPHEEEVKASLYQLAAGDLSMADPLTWLTRAVSHLERAVEKETALANRLALLRDVRTAIEDYHALNWSAAVQETGLAYSERLERAVQVFQRVRADAWDPLYWLATAYLGRSENARYVRDGSADARRRMTEHYTELLEEYPGDLLARMSLGEKFPWKSNYENDVKGAPEWAALAREALGRICEVVDYWVEERQLVNGELGGGFEADCRMLELWSTAALIAGHENALLGIHRLVEGVWESGEIADGYAARTAEVDRTSSLVADTLPIVMALDYGNPIPIERAMATARCMRDTWTARDRAGKLRFRSMAFSASQIDSASRYAADIPYNARAVRPVRWLAWYNRNPEAVRLCTEWGRAWLDAVGRSDAKKPTGIVPASVRFPSGELGGVGEFWRGTGAGRPRFSGGTGYLYGHLLGCWSLTGDSTYLGAHRVAQQLLKRLKGDEKYAQAMREPGSQAWAADRSIPRDIVETMRRTAEARPAWSYPGDSRRVAAACRDSLETLRTNAETLTSEVVFTDRIPIHGARHLLEMYTGAWGGIEAYPSFAITWPGAGKDFAAWVLEAGGSSVDALVYGFQEQPRDIFMRFWRLRPGVYEMQFGSPDAKAPLIQELVIQARGEGVYMPLPSRKTQRLTVRRVGDLPVTQKGKAIADRPDWAIVESDVRWEKKSDSTTLNVVVHNIGSVDAPNGRVVATLGSRSTLRDLPLLKAPLDLQPSRASVGFELAGISKGATVTLTVYPSEGLRELTSVNNEIVVTVPGN